ncbi:MAG: thiamine phosphate synthase, partial [Tissierellia bacterium]|nr:thiamine phosphate synthase [Tissierellia bacterium]
EDSVVGLSASKKDIFEYIKTTDVKDIDYFGAGPLHETSTKPDCGLDDNGKIITRSYEEIKKLGEISPIPVVIGGGVKLEHIPDLAKTGIDGFFVVSAISEAENPKLAAKEMIEAWNKNK